MREMALREMALRERAPSALMVGESRRRGLRVAMNLAGASPRWEPRRATAVGARRAAAVGERRAAAVGPRLTCSDRKARVVVPISE